MNNEIKNNQPHSTQSSPSGGVRGGAILPIYTYGNAVLRKEAEDISPDYPDLNSLIDNMFETMYNAEGVGLAAPQIGLDIRLFVIHVKADEENPELTDFKIVMINPEMLETSNETQTEEEGCLSVPGIHENVSRAKKIKISYLDTNFNEQIEEFEDFRARVIQHEYDHLEGKFFTDKINPLRRQLLKSKLSNIAKGKASAKYRIK
jgi:peptide deformylase